MIKEKINKLLNGINLLEDIIIKSENCKSIMKNKINYEIKMAILNGDVLCRGKFPSYFCNWKYESDKSVIVDNISCITGIDYFFKNLIPNWNENEKLNGFTIVLYKNGLSEIVLKRIQNINANDDKYVISGNNSIDLKTFAEKHKLKTWK